MELEMEFCIVLEQTVLMMPQTCLQVDPKPVYQLSKLDMTDKRTNGRTNGRTDICDSRAAFAAENKDFYLLQIMSLKNLSVFTTNN